MGKTFYWVGGATGANILEAYNWNNPKNWIVQNSTIGGLAVSGLNQGTSNETATTSSNPANRFNVSTGSIGAVTDLGSFCPGIGDVVIIGELPAIGNNTPKQVKAPLLFGGCGITSGLGWTGGAGHASWSGAAVASGTGVNIGIESITIKNNYLPNTMTPIYPFEWVGGGITASNQDVINWLSNRHSREEIVSLSNNNTSDLRLIVKEHVTTDCDVSYEGQTSDKPLKVSLLFKGSVKIPQPVPTGATPMSVVKTRLFDTSSHIALGLFNGAFDYVMIKGTQGSPDTRFIMTGECYLNEVYVDGYAGSFYLDSLTKINKMELLNTVWYGNAEGSGVLQDFTIESSFSGIDVRGYLGYAGVLPATHSTLNVGPCSYIHPSNVNPSGVTPYEVAYPPTLVLGCEIPLTLLGEEQKIPTLSVEGKPEDSVSYLNGRWHLSFKGSTNINYMKVTSGVIKANPYAPLISKVRIGTAELVGGSEITFTRSCPIVNAGDQDIWYFGEMTDKLRGGLKFLDSTGLIWGSKGIVAANTFESRTLGKDSRTGDLDYFPIDTEGSVNI